MPEPVTGVLVVASVAFIVWSRYNLICGGGGEASDLDGTYRVDFVEEEDEFSRTFNQKSPSLMYSRRTATTMHVEKVVPADSSFLSTWFGRRAHQAISNNKKKKDVVTFGHMRELKKK